MDVWAKTVNSGLGKDIPRNTVTAVKDKRANTTRIILSYIVAVQSTWSVPFDVFNQILFQKRNAICCLRLFQIVKRLEE